MSIAATPRTNQTSLAVLTMPMHNGFLPREGFKSDTVLKIIRGTVLNPKLMLPLLLLAKYTKRGHDWSILHPTAYSRIKFLLGLGILKAVNRYFSQGVLNNWVDDKYDWAKEIVLITGGAGGIGGHVVQLLAEQGIKVVVLDIQPLTFKAGKLHSTPSQFAYQMLKSSPQVRQFTTSNAISPLPKRSQPSRSRSGPKSAPQQSSLTTQVLWLVAPSSMPQSATSASHSMSTPSHTTGSSKSSSQH